MQLYNSQFDSDVYCLVPCECCGGSGVVPKLRTALQKCIVSAFAEIVAY